MTAVISLVILAGSFSAAGIGWSWWVRREEVNGMITLDDAAWADFEDLLERPAVYKPRLAALLSEETPVFDD